MVITFSLLLFAMLLLAPIINWSTEGVADNSGDSIGAALNITAG
jgi:Ca2+/H+ antiporter